jgi:hypothetical protein
MIDEWRVHLANFPIESGLPTIDVRGPDFDSNPDAAFPNRQNLNFYGPVEL